MVSWPTSFSVLLPTRGCATLALVLALRRDGEEGMSGRYLDW